MAQGWALAQVDAAIRKELAKVPALKPQISHWVTLQGHILWQDTPTEPTDGLAAQFKPHSDQEEDLIPRSECWWYKEGGPGAHIPRERLKDLAWGMQEVQRSVTELTVVIPLVVDRPGSMAVLGYNEAPFEWGGGRAFISSLMHETVEPGVKLALFYGHWVEPTELDLQAP